MQIARIINGEEITITITPDELFKAEVEYYTERICERFNIRDKAFAAEAVEIFVQRAETSDAVDEILSVAILDTFCNRAMRKYPFLSEFIIDSIAGKALNRNRRNRTSTPVDSIDQLIAEYLKGEDR